MLAQGAAGDSAIQHGNERDVRQTLGSSASSHPSQGAEIKPERIIVSPEPGKRQSGVESLPLPEFNRPQESVSAISGGQAQGFAQGAVGDSAIQYGSARDVPPIPGSFPSVPENPSQGDYPKPEGIPASLEAGKRGSEVESLPLPESTHSAGRESGASGRNTSQGATTATPEDNVPQYPGSDAPQTSRPSAPLTQAMEDRSTGHPTDADMPTAPGSAFKENLSARGNKLREEVANSTEDNHRTVETASTSLTQQGAKVQQKVKSEQGRYVTGRVIKKAAKEGMGTLEDLRNLAKGTSSDLRKLSDGEPQQK